MAAVKALASVAHKLYDSDKEAADREGSQAGDSIVEANPAAATLVSEHVLNALLVAVEDYSTDNRQEPDLQPALVTHLSISSTCMIACPLCYMLTFTPMAGW